MSKLEGGQGSGRSDEWWVISNREPVLGFVGAGLVPAPVYLSLRAPLLPFVFARPDTVGPKQSRWGVWVATMSSRNYHWSGAPMFVTREESRDLSGFGSGTAPHLNSSDTSESDEPGHRQRARGLLPWFGARCSNFREWAS
jgi:hypothetical protein